MPFSRSIRNPVRSEPPPQTVQTVAIVTDDGDLASVCTRVLSAEGYAVRTASHSGHVMLACLQGERIDVLVSEISMDEESGPALTRRLRRYNPDLRAVYIAKPGTVCAAENVIVCPFTREDLLSAIRLQTSQAPSGERPGR